MLTDERPCRFPHWRVAPPAKARVPPCGTFSRPGCKPFHMRRAGNLPHLPEIPLESHPYHGASSISDLHEISIIHQFSGAEDGLIREFEKRVRAELVQSRDPAFPPRRREWSCAQGDQRQGDLSADRAADRSPLVFCRAVPLPRIQLRFRHLSRQRRNASSRDEHRSEGGAAPLPRSWTAPWTRSEFRTSSAPTTGASRGCCSGSRRSTASAITRRAAIRPTSMAVRRCTARRGEGLKFVRDHVFDSDHVDSQLGTAVILHAMMSLDSSITLDGSPQFAGRTEPEDDAASTIVLMQQALNKLGANPPLVEDGISGPKTGAAVSQFQAAERPEGYTGLLDGATVAALTRATQAGGSLPSGDISKVLKRLEDLAQLLPPAAGGVTPGTTTPGNTLPATNDPISLFERLFSLINKTAPVPGPVSPTNPAPVDQLKQVVDLLSTAQQGRQAGARPGQRRARRDHRQAARRQEDGTRHRRLGAHCAALFGDREPECRRYCRTARNDRIGGAGPRPVRDAISLALHGLGRRSESPRSGRKAPRRRRSRRRKAVCVFSRRHWQ